MRHALTREGGGAGAPPEFIFVQHPHPQTARRGSSFSGSSFSVQICQICLFVQPRRLGSTTRNNKVPRMLTPAGVLELVWPGTTMAKTLDVWIALSQQPRVFPWRRNKSHATYCKSKSQSLIVTIARCEPWACHWTEFWLKRPSAILHRA